MASAESGFEGESEVYQEEDALDTGGDGDDSTQDDGANANDDASMEDDADIEAIRARVREMEEEAEKIRQIQSEVEKQMNLSGASSLSSGAYAGSPHLSLEEKLEADNKSIYVGNVDYGATAEELEAHFHGCGSVNRVTILCDKFTGHPKGFAYIEFADKDSVQTAMALDESLFRGRQIKVNPKRTNRPGISSTNRPPRSRRRGNVIVRYVYGAPRRRGGFRRRNFYSPY